jgi:hypothetical protein
MSAVEERNAALEKSRAEENSFGVLDTMLAMASALATGIFGILIVMGTVGLIIWKIF